MASTIDNNPLVSSAVREILPSRRRESRLSPACATFSSLLKPRNPQLPLIVWMVRKMLDRSSSAEGSDSSFTSSLSRRSRFSMLSTRKSLIRSSITSLRSCSASRENRQSRACHTESIGKSHTDFSERKPAEAGSSEEQRIVSVCLRDVSLSWTNDAVQSSTRPRPQDHIEQMLRNL